MFSTTFATMKGSAETIIKQIAWFMPRLVINVHNKGSRPKETSMTIATANLTTIGITLAPQVTDL